MVYIHVPYCKSFCTYCGFYSELCPPEAGSWDVYAEAALGEIKARSEEIISSVLGGVNTLYIGGGTPSVLPPSVLGRLAAAVKRVLEEGGVPSDFAEFTVEVNPEDVVRGGRAYAESLREAGVDRVSMGVQSFDDRVLRWMNRRHDSLRAREAFYILRGAGFDNISVDLIFGVNPENISQDVSDGLWESSIDAALALHPEHISAYQLSIDPESALAFMVEDGRYVPLDDDRCREQYDTLCRKLAQAGYEHYEISNFSLPGRRAVHNSAYWTHLPYVGIGPAAHSFSGKERSWNPSDTASWLRSENRGSETPDSSQLDMETLMLGLRTSDGLPQSVLERICPPEALALQKTAGHLEKSAIIGNLRIPERDFFISDNIIEQLI